MKLSTRHFTDVVVVAPAGRLDHQTASHLEQALVPLWAQSANAPPAVVLDFAGVEYISSVGLRVLMIAAKEMRAKKARIGVAALQPVVAEIFAISRFDRVLEVFPSVRGAIEQFSPAALVAFDAAFDAS